MSHGWALLVSCECVCVFVHYYVYNCGTPPSIITSVHHTFVYVLNYCRYDSSCVLYMLYLCAFTCVTYVYKCIVCLACAMYNAIPWNAFTQMKSNSKGNKYVKFYIKKKYSDNFASAVDFKTNHLNVNKMTNFIVNYRKRNPI